MRCTGTRARETITTYWKIQYLQTITRSVHRQNSNTRRISSR
jgi:hypothetical protein